MAGRVISRTLHISFIDALLLAAFARRLRVDGEGVDGAGKFIRQRCINHAMAVDSALPFEGLGHDINTEMRLAAGAMARVAFMQM
jgi:hypothetical protein